MNRNVDQVPDEELRVAEELTSENKLSGIEAEGTASSEVTIHEPFDPDKIDVKTRNMTLDLILKRIEQSEIDMMPDFQRRAGIWDRRRKAQLIESLLLRIPLPVFYMAANENESWSVVDGLQRLTTLKDFILDGSFALDGLEFLSEFNGMTYDKLGRQMQRRILETELTLHVIQPGTPAAVMINIFKRINTGGMPLSSQEIRNALLQGRSTRVLKELSESTAFKRATSNKIRDERMADRECVLRFAAFWLITPSKYVGGELDSVLVKTMKQINNWDDAAEENLKRAFQRAMDGAYRIFGKYAFRKFYGKQFGLSPINKALFEVWSVLIANLTDEQIETLVARKEKVFEKLAAIMLSDYSFVSSISVGTGDASRVKLRFSRILMIIQETLDANESEPT